MTGLKRREQVSPSISSENPKRDVWKNIRKKFLRIFSWISKKTLDATKSYRYTAEYDNVMLIVILRKMP